MHPVGSTRLRRSGWLLLYALLCALEFVVGKAKEAVEQRILPDAEEPDEPDPGLA